MVSGFQHVGAPRVRYATHVQRRLDLEQKLEVGHREL